MISKLLKPFVTATVVGVIVAAFLVSLARVLLPLVGHYRQDIEDWIHNVMGYPVTIGDLDAVWRGLSPTLELKNVSLSDPRGGTRIFVFEDVSIELDLLRSIVHRRIEPGAVVLRGLKLTVTRTPDGALALAGVVTGGAARTSDPRLTEWFLTRKRLNLEDAELTWHDQAGGRAPVMFTDVNVAFIGSGRNYLISGSGNLPAVFGRQLEFRARFFGNPSKPQGWSGEAYTRAAGVRLAEWSRTFPQSDFALDKGSADAELWTIWIDGRLHRLEGELSTYGLKVANKAGEALALDAASARIKWERDDENHGWRLVLSRFVLAFDNHAWVPTTLGVAYSGGADEPLWEVSGAHLVIQDVQHLARFALGDEQLPEVVRNLNPQGELFDFYGRGKSKETSTFFFRARLQDFSTSPHEKIPGVQGIDGVLYVDNDNVLVNLNAENAQAHLPRLFRQPLEISRATGAVLAHRNSDGWTFWSDDLRLANQDIMVDASVDLELPRDGAPTIDLTARYARGRGERTPVYLPAGIMKPALVEWLDKAILGGNVTDGGVILRGPLNKFPYRQGEGRFEVRFNVVDGKLAYAPRWPVIENLSAEIVFSQHGLRVHGHRGTSLGAQLRDVELNIPELQFDPEMTLRGFASATAAAGWKHVTETPLRELVGDYVATANLSGQARLDLAIKLPLHDRLPPKIDGKITAGNVGMVFDGSLPVDLAAINGVVSFSERGLNADGIEANVLGQPAKVSIRTEPGKAGERALVFAADGSLSMATLRSRLPIALLNQAQGSGPWRAMLRIAPTEKPHAARLAFDSDLRGVAVALPAPAGKTAAELRPLHMTLDFGGPPSWPLHITYGKDVQGTLGLTQQDGAWSVGRGVIQIGSDTQKLLDPALEGLQLAANVAEIDLGDYMPLGGGGSGDAGRDSRPMFSRVALTADKGRLWGQSWQDVRITVLSKESGRIFELASDRAKGVVVVPADGSRPLKADFDFLRIDTDGQERAGPPTREATVDPRSLPAIQFSSQALSLGEIELGSAKGSITKAPGGLRVAGAQLRNGPTAMEIDGNWTHDGKSAATMFNASMESSDFGETLKQLGYANTVDDGRGSAELKLRWGGAPMDYEPGRLNGDIRINVSDGQVMEVDPGAGRILGILSVQSLPRRLTLDFSDVFEQGFGFSNLDGRFTVHDGVANIDAFELKGPSAYINISGQINLAQRTYDQRVQVIPNVSGNLPIVVGVLGTPLAGAAVWVTEKLFRRPLGDLTQVNYRVSGPWHEPSVERLSREALLLEEEKATQGAGSP